MALLVSEEVSLSWVDFGVIEVLLVLEVFPEVIYVII